MSGKIMKFESVSSIFFLFLGFSLGGAVYKYISKNNVEAIIEKTTKNEWVEAENYLAIAKAIRGKRYDEALMFSENMVELKVNEFLTKHPSPSKYEASTLQKINNYKEENCSQNCLLNIK
jgi:ribosomal protein L22